MRSRLKPVATGLVTAISAFASTLKVLEWLGYTRSNLAAWPLWLSVLLWLVVFAVTIVGIGSMVLKWTGKRAAIKKSEMEAYALRLMLRHLTAWATELRDQLETIRHACEDNDVKLPYPLASVVPDIPQYNSALRQQIIEFRCRFAYYLHLFQSCFPTLGDSVLECQRNTVIPYIELKRLLERHLLNLNNTSMFIKTEYVKPHDIPAVDNSPGHSQQA